MFGSLFELATNVAKVVVAPIEVVAHVANAAVKPIAEGVAEVVKDVKDSL
jgi:hypothetical protein